MWMMGYNEEVSMPDSRKLRPLIPKPPMTCSSPTSPCLGLARLHAPDHFFAFNHHLAEQSKTSSSVVVSSRWNPTPEQLRALEELYRRGTRTPSADQIQHITAQLRRFGKIEGKNVFYWFQNHKARERQKRRRHFFDSPSPSPSPHLLHNIIPKHDDDDADDGGRVAGFEVEQNNNTSTTHCTTSPPEILQEDNSRSTKAASMAEPCRTGWVQYDQRELQQQQQQHMMMRRRNATWHTLPATARVTTTKGLADCTSSNKNYQDYLNIFITHEYDHHHHRLLHPNTISDYDCDDNDQTLELFPLRSENGTATSPAACTYNHKLMMMTDSPMDATPNYQFFEFLPLKN